MLTGYPFAGTPRVQRYFHHILWFYGPDCAQLPRPPHITFIHISGQKKADPNFGNVFGAMEEMKYIAGMVAGAKAMEDGTKRVGIIAPYPIAEVIRLSKRSRFGH